MKIALVNPPWTFDGSIYFGCREPHLPLELGYTRAMLEAAGHEVLLIDAHLQAIDSADAAAMVADFSPAMTVVATAPTYLFWRCAQPELRVPAAFIRDLNRRGGLVVAVGPHGSTTPGPTLRKLKADAVVMGECEEVVTALAEAGGRSAMTRVAATAWIDRDGTLRVNGTGHASRFTDLPPISWPDDWVRRHRHHHHRFDAAPDGPGAEVEASRGCPYACTFCAKLDFRDRYRRRDLNLLLAEIDRLIAQGVTYLYFIDEIFLPQTPLLEALVARDIRFGIQTRIDLWKPDMLALLGRAGCVSIEAGVESLTVAGRAALDKRCRIGTDELTRLLITAREHVPFVQANLIGTPEDDPAEVTAWRDLVQGKGVWANDPVPLYPYPASPQYRQMWGLPDDHAWERAHDHYLAAFDRFSDIQDERPVALARLEAACGR